MISRRAFLVRGAGLALASCARGAPTPVPAAGPSQTPAALATPIAASPLIQKWILREPPYRLDLVVRFATDPSARDPRLRAAGQTFTFARQDALRFLATIDTATLPTGRLGFEVVERVSGADVVVASAESTLSAPAYVAWTLDHEGYDEPDALTANVAALADRNAIPMTILFSPRILVPGAVPTQRRDAIVRWTLDRAAKGDEIGMHLHMQFDFVRDAGVPPRAVPRWGVGVGGDGYDVPMTAFDEAEQQALVRHAVDLMAAASLPRPTSFRAGGLFADARTLRAVADAGFTADTSAREAGTFGALRSPWTLPLAAPPYRPNRDDANRGDPPTLGLLEVPNTAGNSFSDDLVELQRRQRAIWPGGAVDAPRVLDLVSHPSTFDAREGDKVAAAFAPLLDARADRDRGPVRFVRLRELVGLWR